MWSCGHADMCPRGVFIDGVFATAFAVQSYDFTESRGVRDCESQLVTCVLWKVVGDRMVNWFYYGNGKVQ